MIFDRIHHIHKQPPRYVLSASDPVDSSPMQPCTRQSSQKDKLLELMRAQSYEALAIQDRTTAAQLQVSLSQTKPEFQGPNPRTESTDNFEFLGNR